MLPDKLPIYVVVGSEPDKGPLAMEIFMEPERAEQYVMDGVMAALVAHRGGRLQPNEQLSMIMTIGDHPDDGPEKLMSASVVVMGEDHRHVWDFRVEKRWAPRQG